MTDTTSTAMTTRTPWHLWAVGGLALLWNGFGGYDYVMTQTNNAAYLAQFTPEQRAYFDSFPMWMEVVWAVGVWGAVLGSVLLLLRSKWAFHAFLASLIAFAVIQAYQMKKTQAPPMTICIGHIEPMASRPSDRAKA